jgi:hypothetical protein
MCSTRDASKKLKREGSLRSSGLKIDEGSQQAVAGSGELFVAFWKHEYVADAARLNICAATKFAVGAEVNRD